jgi:large subunit ribosomal protein L18
MGVSNIQKFNRRKDRIRYKLKTQYTGRPRLTVLKSNKNIHAQIIDAENGNVLASASTVTPDLKGKLKIRSNKAAAAAVGEQIAKVALKNKVTEVTFDRSGYIYHGKIKELADAARKAGLKF